MDSDFLYWWRAGWWSRAGVIACFATIGVAAALIYDYVHERDRWLIFKAEHHCTLLLRPGEGGPDDARNGSYVYHCDNGPMKRPPHSP